MKKAVKLNGRFQCRRFMTGCWSEILAAEEGNSSREV